MRFALFVIAALVQSTTFAQDVLMESDSDEEQLLKVENTGESTKKLLKVVGNGTEENSTADIGVEIEAVDMGVGSFARTFGIYSIATGFYGRGVYADGYMDGVQAWGGSVGVEGSGNAVGVAGYSGSGGAGIYGNGYDTSSYAGYFAGNVAVMGDCDPCSPSDSKFKKNIQPLDGALLKVMALNPKSYEMRVDEFKGRIPFTSGRKYGLIAEEVAVVMPELVHSGKIPMVSKPTKRGEKVENVKEKVPVEFQMISYSRLIPVLVKAMQEQQAMIEALKAEVVALKK